MNCRPAFSLFNCAGLPSHRISHFLCILPSSPTLRTITTAQAQWQLLLITLLALWVFHITVKSSETLVLITVSPAEAGKRKAGQRACGQRACHSLPGPAWPLQHWDVCPCFHSNYVFQQEHQNASEASEQNCWEVRAPPLIIIIISWLSNTRESCIKSSEHQMGTQWHQRGSSRIKEMQGGWKLCTKYKAQRELSWTWPVRYRNA